MVGRSTDSGTQLDEIVVDDGSFDAEGTAAAEAWREGGTRDAGGALTVWLTLLLLLPQDWVVPGVGAAGTPAILFGLALGVWFVASRISGGPILRGRRWVTGLATVYAATVLMSSAFSFNRELVSYERTGGERFLIVTVSMLSILFLTAGGVSDRARIDVLLRRLTVLGAIVSVIAAAQFFLKFDLPARIDPLILDINNGELPRSIVRSSFNRATGTTAHAIELGVLLAVMIPISLHYVLHARTRQQRNRQAFITLCLLGATPLTLSRSGVVCLAIAIGTLASIWCMRRLIQIGAIGLAMIVAFQAAVPGLLGSVKALFLGLSQDTSITARTSDYEIALDLVAQRPWFGRGPGTFGADTDLLLDNQMLKSLIEIGWIGTLALSVFFIGSAILARSIRTRAPDDETRHLAQAIYGGILAMFAAMFFVDFLAYFMVTGVLFFLAGITGSLHRITHRNYLATWKPFVPADPVLRDFVAVDHPKWYYTGEHWYRRRRNGIEQDPVELDST